MASLSATLPDFLARGRESHASCSPAFRKRSDAPASPYLSLSLLPSDLHSILLPPSQRDLLQHLILQQLSQLAADSECRSALLSPSPADALALRETSPSSKPNPAASEAISDAMAPSNSSYTIYDMARRSSEASLARRASESFHTRPRRAVQQSTASGHPTNPPSCALTVSLPASPTPDLIAITSSDSSQLSSPPSGEDDSHSKPNMPNQSSFSARRSTRQTRKSDTLVFGKRRKVIDNRHDNALLIMDQSYYTRTPSLEDQRNHTAKAGDDADEHRRRTRRSDHIINPLKSRTNTTPTKSVLQHSTSKNARKRKASATGDATRRGLLTLQDKSYHSEALKLQETLDESPEARTTRSEAGYGRLRYPPRQMAQDPKSRLKFMLGLLEHEHGDQLVTQTNKINDSTGRKAKEIWPKDHKVGKIYSSADGDADYRPDLEVKGSPARSSRGGGRGGRGRGGGAFRGNGSRGGGNGNGGRGRPRGRKNGGDDDPEPPRKTQLTEEEEEEVKRLKLRQQELKKLFGMVGAHQAELLDQLIARDLSKLVKKARAHTKAPEYEQVQDDLEDMMESQQMLARKRYEISKAAEIKRYEQERELIETEYRRRCQDTHMEHLQGLQGDMISLKKAHATALDETRTEAGSEVDYFPRYHECPEPDAHVRGYVSSKIIDEKPFKEYHESRGDLDLQDVINEDITGPMIESIQKESAKHAEEHRIQQTQTIDALSIEANLRLDDMKGYLISRPLRHENDAYALSVLADVSGYMAKQHPRQQYMYIPLAPGEQLPPNSAPFGQHLGQINGRPLAPAPTPVVPQPIAVTTVPSKRSRNKSKASISSISSISSIPPIRPSLSLQTQTNGGPHTPSASVAPSPVISTGPGQPIAPAPPKALPPFSATTPIMQPAQSPFRRPSEPASQRFQGFSVATGVSGPPQAYGPPPQVHTSLPGAVPQSPRMLPSPRASGGSGGHQFIFQPPAGMPSSPKPAYSPQSPVGGLQGGTQGKIPVTFVNQTVASRKAAAAAKANRKHAADQGNDSGPDSKAPGVAGDRRESGGQRMLLPKH